MYYSIILMIDPKYHYS